MIAVFKKFCDADAAYRGFKLLFTDTGFAHIANCYGNEMYGFDSVVELHQFLLERIAL
ncbi:hypothetical protein LCGC14_3078130, partial [marine sediment metagenome]